MDQQTKGESRARTNARRGPTPTGGDVRMTAFCFVFFRKAISPGNGLF
jgi:hypothetical protein